MSVVPWSSVACSGVAPGLNRPGTCSALRSRTTSASKGAVRNVEQVEK